MTKQRLAQVTAWLLMAYALDVVVPVIDIFGLPLPRYVASMSFSSGFMLAALSVLIPLARLQRTPLVRPAELALIGILALWTGLESIAGLRGDGAHFDLVLEFVPLLLVLTASRLHLEVFGSRHVLVSAFVLATSAFVVAHTALLVGVALQIPLPRVNVGELTGRNAIAQLMPVCLWLLAFFPAKGWPVFGRRYNLLLALGLLNIWLTSARSALLVTAWCVMMGVVLWFPVWKSRLRAALLPTGLLVVLATALAYPVATSIGEQLVFLAGQGDNAMSFWSRSHTNFILLEKLAQDPVLGLGWAEVATTKVFGYMGHTLYVNILAAYGLAGTVPVILLAVLWLASLSGEDRNVAGHLVFLAIVIGSVFNNVFAYFALPLALIGVARLQPSFHQTNEYGSTTSYRT